MVKISTNGNPYTYIDIGNPDVRVRLMKMVKTGKLSLIIEKKSFGDKSQAAFVDLDVLQAIAPHVEKAAKEIG